MQKELIHIRDFEAVQKTCSRVLSGLTLNLTSADYSALMTSWTKDASNMKGIALKAAFSLVLMFEVVFESSEIF